MYIILIILAILIIIGILISISHKRCSSTIDERADSWLKMFIFTVCVAIATFIVMVASDGDYKLTERVYTSNAEYNITTDTYSYILTSKDSNDLSKSMSFLQYNTFIYMNSDTNLVKTKIYTKMNTSRNNYLITIQPENELYIYVK